jgi:pimeloyl-ACP methyl ester carboxylesterase
MGERRTPRRSALLAGLVATALVAGCSSSTASKAGSSSTTTTAHAITTTAPLRSAPPEQYTGPLDGFYRVPKPLPHGAPGTLIRVQAMGTADGATSIRVMYHSQDARHLDRAVTGVITYPTAAAPKGGWPVVSWAHGTTGLTSICAPSRAATPAPDFGIQGVRVATDYLGLGPIGERHAYLDGPSEAYSVIDAVRAARFIPATHASTRWVAVGHSQGGHAALWTNQLGATYAPELHLLGTVTVAPASVLQKTFGPNDQVVPRMVGIMALYGMATDHPELHPDDYVGAEVKAKAGIIDHGCLDDIVNAMVTIPAKTFYKVDPRTHDPAKSLLVADDPGHVKVASPLMLVWGTIDPEVVPARVQYLFHQLCRLGQVTQITKVEGAGHGTVVAMGAAPITAWLKARIAGKPAPDSC